MTKRQEIIKLLNTGNYTDREIAELVGTTHGIVNNYRHQNKTPLKTKWSNYSHLIGVKSDKELGEIMGITANAVTRKRLRMGIVSGYEHPHTELIKKYLPKLINPKTEVKTKLGGSIDILTETSIYECKVILYRQSILEAIGQLLIYSLEYPFHKKVILFNKNDCPSHIIKSLKILGISLVFQKI